MHLRNVHINFEFPSIISDVCQFGLHQLEVLSRQKSNRWIKLLRFGRERSLLRCFGDRIHIVRKQISYENSHKSVCRILKAHSNEVICIYQCEAHLRSLFLQIIEDISNLKSRDYIFEEFLYVLVILCPASRVHNILQIPKLIQIRNDSMYLLHLLNSIVDMQTVKYVLLF